MRRGVPWTPLVLSSLILAGCSGPLVRDAPDLTAPSDFPNHSAAQVLARMEAVAARDSIRSFSSQAEVAIRSPEEDADAAATLRQRGADTLWASLRGPFNIEGARALATADSFFLWDKLQGRLFIGPTAAAERLVPGPVGLDEIRRTLTGTLLPGPAVPWTLTADSSGEAPRYRLVSPGGDVTAEVDPATWRLARYARTEAGRLVDERRFSAFDVIEGRVLPRRIELANPAEDVRVTIEHRRLTLNPARLDFPFDPGDTPREPIE